MGGFTLGTTIDAPQPLVWDALADIGSIHVWNPGVEDSFLVTEAASGLGAERHCALGGRNYVKEQVVEFDDGEALTMRVVETNLPFDAIDIRFLLTPVDGGTHVGLRVDYRLKYGPLGWLADTLYVRRTYGKGMQNLLAGLKQHAEETAATS